MIYSTSTCWLWRGRRTTLRKSSTFSQTAASQLAACFRSGWKQESCSLDRSPLGAHVRNVNCQTIALVMLSSDFWDTIGWHHSNPDKTLSLTLNVEHSLRPVIQLLYRVPSWVTAQPPLLARHLTCAHVVIHVSRVQRLGVLRASTTFQQRCACHALSLAHGGRTPRGLTCTTEPICRTLCRSSRVVRSVVHRVLLPNDPQPPGSACGWTGRAASVGSRTRLPPVSCGASQLTARRLILDTSIYMSLRQVKAILRNSVPKSVGRRSLAETLGHTIMGVLLPHVRWETKSLERIVNSETSG